MNTRGQFSLKVQIPIPVSENHSMILGSWRNQHFYNKIIGRMSIQGAFSQTQLSPHTIRRQSLSVVEEEGSGCYSIQLCSANQDNSNSQGIVQSLKVTPEASRSKIQVSKNISKRFVKLRQRKEGEKNNNFSAPSIKMSRDEVKTFQLPTDLHQFCRKHHLTDKKEQIKYVNTLKRMKKLGQSMGCSVRAKSQGVQLEYQREKQEKIKDIFNYTFSKQFDRIFKKKLLSNTKKCHNEAVSCNSTVQKHSEDIINTLKKNEKDEIYKNYDCKRIQTYLRAKATEKKRYPLYIKRHLDSKIQKIDKKKEAQRERQENETIASGSSDSPRVSGNKLILSRKASKTEEGSQTFRLSNRSNDLNQYQDDILQFLEICQFFERIQKELLRYLPNNHLANKIQTVISQVKFGQTIQKIYKKAEYDRSYFNPSRIVKILKKCEGILGTMNYLANIIKLNVSAERRKRFQTTEQNIIKFQELIKGRNREVCNQLKKTEDLALRKNIFESLSNSKFQCPGMKPSYIQFSQYLQGEGSENIDSVKFTILCDILKFQALIK